VATPLSEGNESAIHSRCSGGAWGTEPDRRQRRTEEGRGSLSVKQKRAEAKFELTAKRGSAPLATGIARAIS